MRFAVLRGNGLLENVIFDAGNSANRDECFAPYVLLRNLFLSFNFQIDTPDKAPSHNIRFEIHQDIQNGSVANSNYLLMFETDLVRVENSNKILREKYQKIFTWNDGLVDGNRFVKLNFPNPIRDSPVDGYVSRSRFCCLIAGNKTLAVNDDANLYPERVKAIRWFEENAPQDFDLYGVGWDRPVMHRGLVGRVERLIWLVVGRRIWPTPFPSYRGKVERKRDVLENTRFSICYENVRDLPGYITEKIFDCFFSGCVPVYWGASNISDYIPANCYIDRRNFPDVKSVYYFLKEMREDEFVAYQQRIADFLKSDAAYQFGAEFFAETIVNTIVQDLALQP